METTLKKALGLSLLEAKGSAGGGCISDGKIFDTENGPIFVKVNGGDKGNIMFEGELEGLLEIEKSKTIRVPHPLKVVDLKSMGTAIAMEYIDMSTLSKYAEKLGEQLARMHVLNSTLQTNNGSVHKSKEDDEISLSPVHKFGFPTTTCCGYIAQDNSWKEDWVEFYAQNRLDYQMKMIQSNYGDREASELWSELNVKIPGFFEGVEVKPALLHGDLWSGNVAETDDGPVIFDPAVFYGHSEYELSIADMFGGFPRAFYTAYHELLPKEHKFDKRKDLYKLFHCLNHWNHFGGGYRSSSISIMKRLLKDT